MLSRRSYRAEVRVLEAFNGVLTEVLVAESCDFDWRSGSGGACMRLYPVE